MSMNKINQVPYLESWCKSYYERVGLKIHPSNVPVEIVLNDIMEQLTMLICHEKVEVSGYDLMNARVKKLETELVETNKALLEATTLINAILETKQNKKAK